MRIVNRIHEARHNAVRHTGMDPDAIYLGYNEHNELRADEDFPKYATISREKNTFFGMEVLVVDKPSYFRVV